MKKILSIISVCISCMMCLLLSVACAGTKPLLDIRKAGDNLRERDYEVVIKYDQSVYNIDGMIVVKLVATGDSGDIIMIEYKEAKIAKVMYECYKVECESEVAWCESELKLYQTYLDLYRNVLDSKAINNFEDIIKELKQEIEEEGKDALKMCGYSGKYFWQASSVQVLEDTK